MGIIFPKIGTADIIESYANNEMYCRELRICLSLHDWYEFSNQEFFHEMAEYLRRKEIQGNIDNLGEVKDLEKEMAHGIDKALCEICKETIRETYTSETVMNKDNEIIFRVKGETEVKNRNSIDMFKIGKVLPKIMKIMEEENLSIGEAEEIPGMLEKRIKANSELHEKSKQFTVHEKLFR